MRKKDLRAGGIIAKEETKIEILNFTKIRLILTETLLPLNGLKVNL